MFLTPSIVREFDLPRLSDSFEIGIFPQGRATGKWHFGKPFKSYLT
jgi:hypothetical protein